MTSYRDDYPIGSQTYRLNVQPSEQFVEAIRPFYKLDAAEKAGRAVLRSYAALELDRLPGQRYIYRHPALPQLNAVDLIRKYNVTDLHSVNQHQIPLVSYVKKDTTTGYKQGLRLGFKAALSDDDRVQVSSLPEFHVKPYERVLDLFLDIPRTQLADAQMLGRASMHLVAGLGIAELINEDYEEKGEAPRYVKKPHRLPLYRQVADPLLYVTNLELLSHWQSAWMTNSLATSLKK